MHWRSIDRVAATDGGGFDRARARLFQVLIVFLSLLVPIQALHAMTARLIQPAHVHRPVVLPSEAVGGRGPAREEVTKSANHSHRSGNEHEHAHSHAQHISASAADHHSHGANVTTHEHRPALAQLDRANNGTPTHHHATIGRHSHDLLDESVVLASGDKDGTALASRTGKFAGDSAWHPAPMMLFDVQVRPRCVATVADRRGCSYTQTPPLRPPRN